MNGKKQIIETVSQYELWKITKKYRKSTNRNESDRKGYMKSPKVTTANDKYKITFKNNTQKS